MSPSLAVRPYRAVCLAFLLTLGISDALAHKVVAGAYAAGDVIEGEIGFSNGDVAVDVLVKAFDEEGDLLGEARTDRDGFFVFRPEKAVAHIFRANMGAGHIAEVRLEIADLPKALAEEGATIQEPYGRQVTAVQGQSAFTAAQEARLADLIRDEIKPLRREIAAYKEKTSFQTILGGLGYILGLFGLWFYLSARKANNAKPETPQRS